MSILRFSKSVQLTMCKISLVTDISIGHLKMSMQLNS